MNYLMQKRKSFANRYNISNLFHSNYDYDDFLVGNIVHLKIHWKETVYRYFEGKREVLTYVLVAIARIILYITISKVVCILSDVIARIILLFYHISSSVHIIRRNRSTEQKIRLVFKKFDLKGTRFIRHN